MTARGVIAGRPPDGDMLIVDIGGGSTELVFCSNGWAAASRSIDVGCVRLTEQFLVSDPPSRAELIAAAGFVGWALPTYEARNAIGVAGTVTTLATLDLGLVEYHPERTHGHRMSRAAVDEQLRRLSAMPLAERARVPGIEPGRAEVIVAGIVILGEIMDAYGLLEIKVSERDLLHGAAYAAAGLPELEEAAVPLGAYVCC